MAEDLKKLVKSVAKNDLMSGIVLFLILVFLGQYKSGAILLVGTIVSMVNFIVSAFITNKFLSKPEKNKCNFIFLELFNKDSKYSCYSGSFF